MDQAALVGLHLLNVSVNGRMHFLQSRYSISQNRWTQLNTLKTLYTLSQKSVTVAVRVFCDSLTFLRQCGQGLIH